MLNWLRHNAALAMLLVTFAALGGLYGFVTPLFEMSDELWHYPVVKTIADGNGLPVQDPANPGPWKQEGSQPPLYYFLSALLTAWIDTSDFDQVWRPNPHVDNGIVTPDGNINLVIHNYAREQWPWRGTVLAVHLVRMLSTLMSVGTVYFAYRIGREVFPGREWLALAAAATVAFTPMFAFISGAVNNDNLAVLLAAVGLWLMIRIVIEASSDRSTWKLSLALGVVLGLSALTKASTLGQLGLAGITMAYASIARKDWKPLFVEGPVIVLTTLAICGWWYYRNFSLYGDPLGLNVFIAILGQRAHPASLRQLWGERFGFMQSYWGLFGGVNIPMPGWTYEILNALAVVTLGGILIVLWEKWAEYGRHLGQWMPTLLTLLWIPSVVVPLVASWARITWSSQGRLVFSAIMCINLWFLAGLAGWLPQKVGRGIAATILGFMATLTLVSPVAWIAPAYRLPASYAGPTSGTAIDFFPPGTDRPAMRLVGYEIGSSARHPGESVTVRLVWQSLDPMDRDWSVFVHLVDQAEILAGQRDTYPGLGLIATSELLPGRRWVDTYVVPISPSAFAPETLSVRVGLYDFGTCPTCIRMATTDGAEFATIGQFELVSLQSEDDVPNPVRFDFDGKMALVGYTLDRRAVLPGETVRLTLYWRGLQPMQRNYTISAQVLGAGNARVAQQDKWPLDGSLPTSAWVPETLVADDFLLQLDPASPPGQYKVQIVVYWADDLGNLSRLPTITSDGRIVDDFVLLTDLKIK